MSQIKSAHSLQGYLPKKTVVMKKAAKSKIKTSDPEKISSEAKHALNTQPISQAGRSFQELSFKNETLSQIQANTEGCTRCKLSKTRTHIVFGEGNPKADIVFVGEAPGEQEDLNARPFIGRAGQLLDKMIEAMGTTRNDVYILNVVKCRPPGNRNPEPDEITRCQPFLLRQLAALKPKVIVALGKFSAQTLLQTETRISELRGHFHPFHGIQLMPTFHPAYLLRNPSAKKEAWEDLKKVAKEAGLKHRSRGTNT